MNPPVAPFVRPLFPQAVHKTLPGADVRAVKRGLSRAGHLPWVTPFTPAYDAKTVKAVKEFQQEHGIDATGNYGRRTHEKLRYTHAEGKPGEWAFDRYASALFVEAAHEALPTPWEKAAARFLDAIDYWISQRARIAYGEVRPFPLVKPPAVPGTTDCSGFATLPFWAVGAPNPNGRPWDGLGYTGTLVEHGHEVKFDKAALGALVFYGHTPASHATAAFPAGSPTHVALWLPGGYVASHGSDPGPLKLPVGYRGDFHSCRQYPLLAA